MGSAVLAALERETRTIPIVFAQGEILDQPFRCLLHSL
jgi:hypothetical protein